MPRHIQIFYDGSTVFFDKGKFDDWCVYVERPLQMKYAPTDNHYFSRLQELGNIYGHDIIYNDFVMVYNQTNATMNNKVCVYIVELTKKYGKDSLEIAIWFTVIYAGMVAEENKIHAPLRKRIKRLGMYQALIDKLQPGIAANYSRGKNWRELDAICKEMGF